MKHRPTIKDVARTAGVSFWTVASALRDEGKVAPATRERVLEAVRTLGYQRNRAASALATRESAEASHGHSVLVAYLTRMPSEADIKWHIRAYIEGARARAVELGYRFEHHNLSEPGKGRSLCRSLYHRGCLGLVLGRALPFDQPWGLPLHLFSVVACSREQPRINVPTVVPDTVAAMKGLLEAVWERGYRRPGLILRTHEPIIDEDRHRVGAALVFLDERVAEADRIPPLRLPFGKASEAERVERTRAWFARWKPDCVIGFNRGEVPLLLDAGVRVPQDAALASLMIYEEHPPEFTLAHMDERREVLGRLAMEALDQRIRYKRLGEDELPAMVAVSPVFVAGSSLPVRKRGGSTRSAGTRRRGRPRPT